MFVLLALFWMLASARFSLLPYFLDHFIGEMTVVLLIILHNPMP
jgi:hypothetical protein